MIKLFLHCDKPRCNTSQEFFYTKPGQTFQDLLNYAKEQGWAFECGPEQKLIECTCMYIHEE